MLRLKAERRGNTIQAETYFDNFSYTLVGNKKYF